MLEKVNQTPETSLIVYVVKSSAVSNYDNAPPDIFSAISGFYFLLSAKSVSKSRPGNTSCRNI